ncbi:hypothetical protein RF11_11548 [Thelohanellus kitauei]|uniref:Uncharacterized protein n=1 Tax=Thelohanellus kitauei TaxID=669202 RepID=A0A0C2MNB8_THEKT|nr:hypothetical protein RF11_11548 [Thelohanellus kitauei]
MMYNEALDLGNKMSGYNPDVWKFFESNSFINNNEERSFVLQSNYKLVFAFLPLVLQIFLHREDPPCPKDYYKLYGLSVLILPTLCVLLVFAVILNQTLIEKSSRHYYIRDGTGQIIKTILLGIIITGLTIGTQFVYGRYFACYSVGPEPITPCQFIIDRHNKEYKNALSRSVLIGWLIIFGTLLLFAALAIYINISSYVEPIDLLLKNFMIEWKKEMQTSIYDEIDRLAKLNAQDSVKDVIAISMETTDGQMPVVHRYIRNVVRFEEQGDPLDVGNYFFI